MTELERARAHLLDAQIILASTRRNGWPHQWFEEYFLAALSWAWEEQEKVRSDRALNQIQVWYDSHLGPQPYEYERGKEIKEIIDLRYALRCALRHVLKDD